MSLKSRSPLVFNEGASTFCGIGRNQRRSGPLDFTGSDNMWKKICDKFVFGTLVENFKKILFLWINSKFDSVHESNKF
ncbi:MAG: hypothetical protein RL003_1268, partial [Bacteroidota bacterium]